MNKIIINCVVLLLLVTVIACGTSNRQMIGKNVDPDVASLGDAKSWNWITDIDEIPDKRIFMSATRVYVYNNTSARKRIKDAIEYELGSRGYMMQSTQDRPDMLVSFYVSEQADTIRRTNGYVTIDDMPVVTRDDVERVEVQPGTLIVNLINNKTKEAVWQGFASGILKPEDLNDKSKISQAVSSIFTQFRYDAKD